MPEPDQVRGLHILLLPDRYAVSRLEPGTPLPAPARPVEGLHAVIACPDELTVIVSEKDAPAGGLTRNGFRLLKVAGPLPFDAVGILASLTAPLARAGISILSVSTYTTDYLLVHETRIDESIRVLEQAGFILMTE